MEAIVFLALLMLIVGLFVFTVCIGIRDGVRKAKMQQSKKVAKDDWDRKPASSVNKPANLAETQPPRPEQIDTARIPPMFSEEEKQFILKVSDRYHKRYISQDDIDSYNLETMDNLFQSMEGWQEWDSSIHHATGQYDRMKRTVKIQVEWYSPVYRIGKVIGSGGTAYLTSCRRCSCPDYRDRKLPCKHMYALAMELDGDVSKTIGPSKSPFRGLLFSLAGGFGPVNGPNGIRHYINLQKGVWETTIARETSALIIGSNPSENKIAIAKNYDMEILEESSLRRLFDNESDVALSRE